MPTAPVVVALPQIQDLQIRIQGSATYVREDYLESIRLLEAGLVKSEDLVTARYPLAQASAAFADAASGRQVKVVLLADRELPKPVKPPHITGGAVRPEWEGRTS